MNSDPWFCCYDWGWERETVLREINTEAQKDFLSVRGVFCEMRAGAEERAWCLTNNTTEDKEMTALQ